MVTASATAVSYLFSGRPVSAAVAVAFALFAAAMRRSVLGKMDALRAQIQSSADHAVSAFRRIHVLAIAINFVQLVLIVWILIAASLQVRAQG